MRKFVTLLVVFSAIFIAGCSSLTDEQKEQKKAEANAAKVKAELAQANDEVKIAQVRGTVAPANWQETVDQKIAANNKKQEEAVDQKIDKRVKPIETSLAENVKQTQELHKAWKTLEESTKKLQEGADAIRKDLQEKGRSSVDADELEEQIVQIQAESDKKVTEIQVKASKRQSDLNREWTELHRQLSHATDKRKIDLLIKQGDAKREELLLVPAETKEAIKKLEAATAKRIKAIRKKIDG